MTTLLGINPRCRSGAAVDCDAFIERLETLGPVVLLQLENGALAEAIDALGDDLERIVLGGGDGTFNLAMQTVLDADVPLGVLPLGTANDFVRSLEIPLEPEAALDVVIAGHTRRVDLGQANGRWFLNAAGIGLGPDLTKKLDREKKRRLGVLAYLSGLVETVGDRRRRRAVLTVDGRRKRAKFMQITIANGVHYGGGMTIAQDAALDDGRFHVLVIRPQTPWSLLAKLVAFRRGVARADTGEALRLLSGARVEVRTRVRQDVTLDGELVAETPLDCRCVPRALEVYAPVSENAGT